MKKLIATLVLILLLATSANAMQEMQKEVSCAELNKVKDAIVSVVGPGRGVRINKVSEYEVVFEFKTGNDLANLLFMNRHTGVQPVGRIYFDLIPMSEKTLIKATTAFVENPGTGNEIINRNIGNKKDERTSHNILEKVASLVDPDYQPEYLRDNEKKKIAEQPKERQLGLTIGESGTVTNVAKDGAANGKIFIGDRLIEINGITLADMDITAIRSYIANKWGAGSSLVMVIEHDNEKKIVTLKKTGR